VYAIFYTTKGWKWKGVGQNGNKEINRLKNYQPQKYGH
jgi:hypothetical protein